MSRKRHVVSIEEAINRNAESALISAIKLRKYWMSQGYNEDKAVEKAVRQACGMLAASGLRPEKLIELFQELKRACDTFIEVLERKIEEPRTAQPVQ